MICNNSGSQLIVQWWRIPWPVLPFPPVNWIRLVQCVFDKNLLLINLKFYMHVHILISQFSCLHLTLWHRKLNTTNMQCYAEKTKVFSQEQACSVLYMVWANAVKFCLHSGNMKFNTQLRINKYMHNLMHNLTSVFFYTSCTTDNINNNKYFKNLNLNRLGCHYF